MSTCGDCKWFKKDAEPGKLGVGWCYCPCPASVPVDAEIPSYTVCERSDLDCRLYQKGIYSDWEGFVGDCF